MKAKTPSGRLEICKKCPFYNKRGICKACGCNLTVKVASVKSSCPKGKW